MIPSYGLCTIPPCEEFAENVCDESPRDVACNFACLAALPRGHIILHCARLIKPDALHDPINIIVAPSKKHRKPQESRNNFILESSPAARTPEIE